MRCPRCGLAELNSGECPICHNVVRSRFASFLDLRKRLEGYWERDNALKTLWAWNLDFYARTRAIIFLLGVMALGVIFSVAFEVVPFLVMGLGLYFALMAFYEVFRIQKKKKEAKE